MVLGTPRHAARRDDGVMFLGCLRQRCFDVFQPVGDAPAIAGRQSHRTQKAMQQRRIGVVDAAFRQPRARSGNLVPGRKQGHPWTLKHCEFGETDGCRGGHILGPQPVAGMYDRVAGHEVLAGLPTVCAAFEPRRDDHEPAAVLVMGLAIFLHGDAVGTLGHMCAREDPGRRAGRQP